MLKNLVYKFVLVFLLLSCSSIKNEPVFATSPLVADEQIAIARITKLIAQPSQSQDSEDNAKKSNLFFNRGLLFDKAGLKWLAYLDYLKAIELNPKNANAYNSLGVIYLVNKEFSSAYEAFDSAIELDDKQIYPYLNRALAFYYNNRGDLANLDIKTYQQQNKNDGYALVWNYFIDLANNDLKAKENLIKNSSQIENNSWQKDLVNYIKGEISEQQLLSFASFYGANKKTRENYCEAYFYIGKMNLLQGNEEKALKYFNKARSTGVFDFLEHKMVDLEIYNLALKKQKKPNITTK